jgi:hypothetical protein
MRGTQRFRDLCRSVRFYAIEMPLQSKRRRAALEARLRVARPRVALVKQDVQDDLYCCPRGTAPRDIVGSTLIRSGPVALFTKFAADFLMVRTEPDPECQVWREKVDVLGWYPLEQLESLRERVPGRSYGQGDFAVSAADVDWSAFDIVIGVDVPIPARITCRYPTVAWCYYVREVKSPAYARSRNAPLLGQDLHLTHQFRRDRGVPVGSHEVDFPYYLQYHGCFDQLLGQVPPPDEQRRGIFLEHHTGTELKKDERRVMEDYGPVAGTGLDMPPAGSDGVREIRTTMAEPFFGQLRRSKYFLKTGGRRVLGTGLVEAIAMGCLALGDPGRHEHGLLFSKATSIHGVADALNKMRRLDSDPGLYRREIARQRRMIDYLCFTRPCLDLLSKAARVVEARTERSKRVLS